MATSRRDFLKKGSLVALVAAIPMGLAEKIAGSERDSTSIGLGLSHAAFKSQLNTAFLINEGTRKVPVKLVTVDDLRRKNSFGPHKECFSLQFQGDQKNVLKQGTYSIEHKRLGVFTFLIVPIGMGKTAPLYEAIINHQRP